MRGFRVRYSLRQPGRGVETGAGWGPVSSSWAEMGSWAKGRAKRSQVMLVRVIRAHKCPQGSEKAPLGAGLQAGVCPVTEPCQELGGSVQHPAASLWPGHPCLVWCLSEPCDGWKTSSLCWREQKTGVTTLEMSSLC